MVSAGKRGARGGSPPAKRTKADQNVMYKVKQVTGALKDDTVEVPGPATNRDMLVSCASFALGLGAASDERHQFQKMVVDQISTVLDSKLSSCTGSVKGISSEVSELKAATAKCQAALDDATGRLDAKKIQIKETKETLKKDEEAAENAEDALKGATKEVTNFDDITAAKTEEKEKYNHGLTVAFATLKSGEWADPKEKRKNEEKYKNQCTKLLEKCGAAESLSSCMALAFQAKPEDRGSFDKKAIESAEAQLSAYLKELEARVSKSPELKQEKEKEQAAAQSALEAAQAKQKASEEALATAEKEKDELSAEVSTAKAAVKKAEKDVQEKEKELKAEKKIQAKAALKIEMFKFLKERLSTETSSYYWQIKGAKYDRELLNLCIKVTQDEVLDLEDAKKIIECAKDGQGITEIEMKTIHYVIDGPHEYEIKEDARKYIDDELKNVPKVGTKEKVEEDGKEVDEEMGELLEKAASQAQLAS